MRAGRIFVIAFNPRKAVHAIEQTVERATCRALPGFAVLHAQTKQATASRRDHFSRHFAQGLMNTNPFMQLFGIHGL
jgi:hypothetical protein